jgi:RNA polymerase sigma-70 factor (ECF subfamily)
VNRRVVVNREFGKLYEKNFRGVVLLILKYVDDFDAAEDLAQDCFLRVYDRYCNIDICMESARNYLYKAAKHAAIDYKRRCARDAKRDNSLIPELKEMNSSFFNQVENYVIEGEVASTVHDILAEFPVKTRQVFIDRVIHEKNLREISREHDITLYKICRIEKELRFYLKKRLKLFCDDSA